MLILWFKELKNPLKKNRLDTGCWDWFTESWKIEADSLNIFVRSMIMYLKTKKLFISCQWQNLSNCNTFLNQKDAMDVLLQSNFNSIKDYEQIAHGLEPMTKLLPCGEAYIQQWSVKGFWRWWFSGTKYTPVTRRKLFIWESHSFFYFDVMKTYYLMKFFN